MCQEVLDEARCTVRIVQTGLPATQSQSRRRDVTLVPDRDTQCDESRPMKDAARVMPGGRGRVRCPRAGLISRLPGGPGIMPAGTMTGVRGAPLEVGAEPAVISAALAKHPRSLARIAPRDHTPLGQSRGGTPAGERARSGRAAQAAFSAARPVRRLRTGSLTAVRLTAVRLPALHVLHFILSLRGGKRPSDPERFRCTGLLRFARNDDVNVGCLTL
jgi:hypothetical protein